MTALKTMTLDQCCAIVSGATPKTSVPEFWDGDICWTTPKDLSDLETHYLGDTPRKITALGLASCGTSMLPTGSVLFSSRAPIGHVAINSVPMATNQGFKSFVPKAELLDAKFLFHWLRKNRAFLESLGNGATFKEVSKATVARIEIDLPPVAYQRRIAAILDQADALRAKRREALAQLDSLTQSIFIEMFGEPTSNVMRWPNRRLSDLVISGDSINYGVVQPGDDVDEGIPLVRVGDLIDGRVRHDSLKKITPVIESAYKRSRLHGDEILVSCVGTIGVVVLAKESEKGFNIARAVARIRLSPGTSREFVAAQLLTKSVQRYFTDELRTVSQPTLNIKQLSETNLIWPPASLQAEFSNRIASLETLKLNVRRASSELDTLFSSLQHRAFRGDL